MSLLISHSERVLEIMLNRAAKRNALDLEMSRGIVDAVNGAQQSEDIACVLLRAAGSVFCAGMDLDEAATVNPQELARVHEELFTMGSRSRKPIVATVNGAALGGGLGLVAQCHVVFAGEGAVFGLPEIQVGLWPLVVYRSVRDAIGARRTLAISLSGRSFPALQAREWGLVHRILPGTEVEERGRAMANRLGRGSPLALSLGMQYVSESGDMSWSEAGKLAAELRVKLMESGDFKEGRRAFKEKREARWPSMPGASQNDRNP